MHSGGQFYQQQPPPQQQQQENHHRGNTKSNYLCKPHKIKKNQTKCIKRTFTNYFFQNMVLY